MEMYVMEALVKLRDIYNGSGSGYIVHLIYAFIEPLGCANKLENNKPYTCVITKRKATSDDVTGIEARYMHETRKMFGSNSSDAIISYPVLLALNKFVQERIEEGDIRICKMFGKNKYKPIAKPEVVPSNPHNQEALRRKYANEIEIIQQSIEE